MSRILDIAVSWRRKLNGTTPLYKKIIELIMTLEQKKQSGEDYSALIEDIRLQIDSVQDKEKREDLLRAVFEHLLINSPSSISSQIDRHYSNSEPEIPSEPYDPLTLKIIQTVIDETSNNPRLPHDPSNPEARATTIYEHALNLFTERGQVGVTFSELKNLVEDKSRVKDVDTATSNLIRRLRGKLENYNYTISRDNSTRRAYTIIPATKQLETIEDKIPQEI